MEFKAAINENEKALYDVKTDIETILRIFLKIKESLRAINPDVDKVPKELNSLLKLINNLEMESKQYKNIVNALRIKLNSAINSFSKKQINYIV